jgi:hypothetical protein
MIIELKQHINFEKEINRFQKDVKTILEQFLVLSLNEYPVSIKVINAMDSSEVAYIQLELIKGLAALYYFFSDNKLISAKLVYNNQQVFFPENAGEKCDIGEVLEVTKEIIHRYIDFIICLRNYTD